MYPMKLLGAALAGLTLATASQACAAVTQIMAPDPAYAAATTKLAIGGTDHDTLTFLEDANVRVAFGSSELLTAGVTWLGWGASPGDAEEDFVTTDVRVLRTPDGVNSVTFTFSTVLSTFGFEASPQGPDDPIDPTEPVDFDSATFTVDYYQGAILQGSITRDINWFFDSRLLAASGAFDRVVVSANDELGFSQVRYALSVVPEPSAWGLMIVGFGAVGAVVRRRRTLAAA